ncbi:MAG: hypothetical protein ACOC85_02110 [Thermoplasmatota archaeon]
MHRTTKAVIEILEYMSKKHTYEQGYKGLGGTKKKQIMKHLDNSMEDPPSESTVTRILKELENQGYLSRRGTQDWYPTKNCKILDQPFLRISLHELDLEY